MQTVKHLSFSDTRKKDFGEGQNGFEMIAPEDRDRAKSYLEKRIKGENPGTVEYSALKKDGTTFPILFHANSIMRDSEF